MKRGHRRPSFLSPRVPRGERLEPTPKQSARWGSGDRLNILGGECRATPAGLVADSQRRKA